MAARTDYASPHAIHCVPDAILVSALGAPDGDEPGGIFMMDHESFNVLGKWELIAVPRSSLMTSGGTWGQRSFPSAKNRVGATWAESSARLLIPNNQRGP